MPWGLADMAKAVGLVILLTILFSLPAAFLATVLAGRSSDLEDSPAALTVLLDRLTSPRRRTLGRRSRALCLGHNSSRNN